MIEYADRGDYFFRKPWWRELPIRVFTDGQTRFDEYIYRIDHQIYLFPNKEFMAEWERHKTWARLVK